MEPQTQTQSFLTIPLAIVVAAIIIAAAIFFGWRGASLPANNAAASEPQSAAVAVALNPISAEDHIRGNPDAPFVLVEYSDTECPFCQTFHTTMKQALEEYGKDGTLAWVYRHFPIDSRHPKARKEAEATECAAELGGNTGFWNFVDHIFEITPANNGLDPTELPKIAAFVKLDAQKFGACLASGKYAEHIERDYQSGLTAGASGTPFNILVLKNKVTKAQEAALAPLIAQFRGSVALSSDKTKITLNGALPYGALKSIIDILLK